MKYLNELYLASASSATLPPASPLIFNSLEEAPILKSWEARLTPTCPNFQA
jgi:hypothetical protein